MPKVDEGCKIVWVGVKVRVNVSSESEGERELESVRIRISVRVTVRVKVRVMVRVTIKVRVRATFEFFQDVVLSNRPPEDVLARVEVGGLPAYQIMYFYFKKYE